jgi:release factor glutamine methyltransferase
MTLIDIQKKAILNTKHNAKLNNLNVNTYVGDFYKTLISHNLKFDFIVCNPPYVDINTLDKTMTKYENRISFTNSDDPKYFYNKLIDNKNKILNKNGKLFFETSDYQLLVI